MFNCLRVASLHVPCRAVPCLISPLLSRGMSTGSPESKDVEVKKTGQQKLQCVKGTHDRFPAENHKFKAVTSAAVQVAESFGYDEITTPILEHSELFERTLGSDSDIVSKEMYTFVPAGSDERITLRPEGTAGAIRAILGNTLGQAMPQKYYYHGPMFRKERPQKGRLRQFHQFGVEFVGVNSEYSDLEIIDIGWQFLRRLRVDSSVELHVNSLGDVESRQAYRAVLERFFKEHISSLSSQSRARLEKGNVLRILDSKEAEDQAVVQKVPSLLDHLSPASQQRFKNVCQGLDVLRIPHKLNPTLVRGLDYYGDTVFEFVTTKLGAQSTVLAGGRYDRLVSVMGHSTPIPGVGWASGIERLVMLAEGLPTKRTRKMVAVINMTNGDLGSVGSARALNAANELRKGGYDVSSWLWLPPKKQLAKASSEGASFALFVAEEDSVSPLVVKNLTTRHEIQIVDVAAALPLLQ